VGNGQTGFRQQAALGSFIKASFGVQVDIQPWLKVFYEASPDSTDTSAGRKWCCGTKPPLQAVGASFSARTHLNGDIHAQGRPIPGSMQALPGCMAGHATGMRSVPPISCWSDRTESSQRRAGSTQAWVERCNDLLVTVCSRRVQITWPRKRAQRSRAVAPPRSSGSRSPGERHFSASVRTPGFKRAW
jgi:hypothetical protein